MAKHIKNINCAVCNKQSNVITLYKENFKIKDINPETYTSRRIPDRAHFRIVRCLECGLTFSNPIIDPEIIIRSYRESEVPIVDDLENAAEIYMNYIKKHLNLLWSQSKVLDIGCGNGFFLKKIKDRGCKDYYGLEPSRKAANFLPKGISKKRIIINTFNSGHFQKDYFDLVCSFQVIDHILNPNQFIKDCFKILKPGGYCFLINHDAKSLTANILGERSPIIDVQHIYLFDKRTIKKIFENNNFLVTKVFNTRSIYTLQYWIDMAPLNSSTKRLLSRIFSPLLRLKIPLRVGNMAIIAQKPR